MTKLQASLALSTPDAYNPFSGGCAATPSLGDCQVSSQASIDAISFDLKRRSKTTLAGRFQAVAARSAPAAGRRARHRLRRRGAPRDAARRSRSQLNGTNTFSRFGDRRTNLSNVAAVSPTPSTRARAPSSRHSASWRCRWSRPK
jgi:iron complex outermembrane receptor protein